MSCTKHHAFQEQGSLRLTLMSCTKHRPCMRLMSPMDAKKRTSVIAWRRSPSCSSSCALAFMASSLNCLPSCFRRNSFTCLCLPFSASCHRILPLQFLILERCQIYRHFSSEQPLDETAGMP